MTKIYTGKYITSVEATEKAIYEYNFHRSYKKKKRQTSVEGTEKARVGFLQMRNIWKGKGMSLTTKLTVKSVMLY